MQAKNLLLTLTMMPPPVTTMLASLIGHKFGSHQNVVVLYATTLAKTKYKLKTSLGVLDEF
jgi:hypothetical protein